MKYRKVSILEIIDFYQEFEEKKSLKTLKFWQKLDFVLNKIS
jgi:hypothetical protein